MNEIPVVGGVAERAVHAAEQGLRVGQWALRGTTGVLENRLEEMDIHNLDVSVRGDFEAILAAERALARVETRDNILTQAVCRRAASTIQVYAEHFSRFYQRGNNAKTSYYAAQIYEMLPFVDEEFSLSDIPLDPTCAELLRAELRSVEKKLATERAAQAPPTH